MTNTPTFDSVKTESKVPYTSIEYYTKGLGLLHREDGPAIEYSDGTKEWFVNGKEYSEEEFNNEFN